MDNLNFSGFSNLQFLSLAQNRLSGTIPNTLQTCTSLILLDLSRNDLSGMIHDFALDFQDLVVLSLGINTITGEIPLWVWSLPKLQVIDLSQNSISGSIPTSLTELQGMQHPSILVSESFASQQFLTTLNAIGMPAVIVTQIYMEYGVIVKGLVASYFFQSAMASIDLSGNNLTNELPDSLGTLLGLVVLNLSSNHLTGSISPTLGSLSNLESLDLSNNELSGTIPTELAQLNGLGVFKVSDNQLSGPIPSAMETRFGNASYLPGNDGLCDDRGIVLLHRPCSSDSANSGNESQISATSEKGIVSDFFSNRDSLYAFNIGCGIGFLGVVFVFIFYGGAWNFIFQARKPNRHTTISPYGLVFS